MGRKTGSTDAVCVLGQAQQEAIPLPALPLFSHPSHSTKCFKYVYTLQTDQKLSLVEDLVQVVVYKVNVLPALSEY